MPNTSHTYIKYMISKHHFQDNTRCIREVSRLFFVWVLLLIVHTSRSSGCNALVVLFQQLLEGPMEVLLCERVNDLRHSRLSSSQLSHNDSI